MIQSKSDYKYYLECDELVNGFKGNFLKKHIINDEWKFFKALRRTEYYKNCRKDIFGKILFAWNFYQLRIRWGGKLGWSIPPNVFGPGLCIVHRGTVVVNGNARIGANCRIHVCVNIGATSGKKEAPVMGDNVYIAPGAKIFGNIIIGDNTAIGANSVVNKSFPEGNMTIAGMPAQKISDKNSLIHLPYTLADLGLKERENE